MRVNTIKFEIRDFNTGMAENFLIADTPENQEKVFTFLFPKTDGVRKSIRDIHFDRMFDFQFENEMSMPIQFIEMSTWLMMLSQFGEQMAAVAETE